MQKTTGKGFFGSHAKSSALVASLVVHAILIVVAVSFVAVKIIIKDDAGFEAKTAKRPKAPLRKLQVPVKVKPKRAPKIRRQIVVKRQVNRKMPTIKMPEIKGVKGGLGSAGSGTGYGIGGVGFSLPEINIFGVKSKGEKVYILLDASAEMMYDEMGGIEAYRLIKEELIRIVDALPSTVLFNVVVFQDGDRYKALFPSMVNASDSNVEVMKKWIAPLNAASVNMSSKDFGTKTLGSGGHEIEKIEVDPIKSYGGWVNPSLMAMKQQADSVYLLTSRWGRLFHRVEHSEGSAVEIRNWDQLYEKAKKKLAKENENRKKKGRPPRILKGKMSIIKAYFPDAHPPGSRVTFDYTPKIMHQVMDTIRKEYSSSMPTTSGLPKKKVSKYSFNVIQFVRQGGSNTEEQTRQQERSSEELKQIARLCHGAPRSIPGLEAIKSCIPQE
jgi:hypothetical protein